MIRNILIITGLIVLYYMITAFAGEDASQGLPTTVVGIMLLTSYLFALVIKKVKLPKLTAYMIMGVILGPIGLKYLSPSIIDQLSFMENLALAFIAITAGGEFRFTQFRSEKKPVLLMLAGQMIAVFLGTVTLFIIVSDYIPFLAELDKSIVYGFAVLLGATALSKSPATTIGIITELKAQGRFTNIVLIITVLKAIVLILLFPFFVAWAKNYLIPGYEFNLDTLLTVITQLGGSIFTGIVIGLLIIWYMKNINWEMSIFLLGVALIITEISTLFGVDILLTSIIVGIVVQNYSKQGNALITEIEMFSLPIYVIFFCFAGASLHLDALIHALPITLFLVVIRLIFLYGGNYLGAAIAKEDLFTRKMSWMSYVGQAGIALGLGLIIERTFPGDLGQKFMSILIATVVINELVGPVLFKYVLIKRGEAGVVD
jgi:Kef-type K+ transport system membrane component KefB